jgi:ABC-type branched-subunit amino acid transport system ATPase component
LLRRVRAESGCSILLIEHSMSLVSSVCDRIVALDQGLLIADGAPDDVLSDDKVVASYLGRSTTKAGR